MADCAITRGERLSAARAASSAGAELGSFVFSLGTPGHAGKAELLVESLGAFIARPDAPPGVAALVMSRGAAIADASSDGARAACAVNFKSKSRVFIVEPGSKPRMAGSHAFGRALVRVFLTGDNLLAVTNDGFCYELSGPGFEMVQYARIARSLDDAAFAGDRLLAFERSRGITGYGASGSQLLRQVERRDLPIAERRFGAFMGSRLIVVNAGRAAAGDTIAVLDAATLRESGRLALPGAVGAIACDSAACAAQLADGTLLEFEFDDSGAPRIAGAAYLPFAVRALSLDSGRITAFGKNGAFVSGALTEFDPGARAVATLRCAVGQ